MVHGHPIMHCGSPPIYSENCEFSYINNEFQCMYYNQESLCNINNSNPIISTSNLTTSDEFEFWEDRIECIENITCYINCNHMSSCTFAHIICPQNANCIINCNTYSCELIDITCRGNNNCYILSNGFAAFRWSIIDAINMRTGNLIININNFLGESFYGSNIYCPIYGDCNITTNTYDHKSFQYSNITASSTTNIYMAQVSLLCTVVTHKNIFFCVGVCRMVCDKNAAKSNLNPSFHPPVFYVVVRCCILYKLYKRIVTTNKNI